MTSWIRDISRVALLAAVFSGLSLAGAQPAAAQTPASLPADLPASLPPSTITLDRMDSATRVGLQVGFDKLDAVTLDHGFGVRAGGVDLSAELVNIGALDGSVPGGVAGRFMHTAGLGLRTQGTNQFHLGTVFPLDAGARGQIWILSAGYQRAMY